MSSPARKPGDRSSPQPPSPTASSYFSNINNTQGYSITGRRAQRSASTAGSVASIGGVLDTARGGDTDVSELGRNAISTLLQNPIVRTGLAPHSAPPSSFKAPTARDIPPVTLTNIRHVEPKTFQPYIAQVGSLYDAFQRAKDQEDGESQMFRRESKETPTDEWEKALNARLRGSVHSRSGSASSVSSPSEMPQIRRRSSGQRRGQIVTPLSTVPAVYSEESFHLENPRTFDIVSERSEVVRQQGKAPDAATTGRKALATNAILQEKLSWYMDTVEVHLISSISTASKSFFSALGSLRELHSEAADSVERIQNLRKDLGKLDDDMALGGLKIISLKQRRENVRLLGEAIAQLKDIVNSVATCEERVQKGDIEKAMDDLDEVEKLIAGDSGYSSVDSRLYQPRDLSSLTALQGASEDLHTLRTRIGKAYEMRFIEALLGDLRSHVDKTSPDATLQRWGASFSRVRGGERRTPAQLAAYLNIDNGFRSALKGELSGLARAKYTGPAAAAFKTQLLREMKSLIRKPLPSSSDDDRESTMSASTIGGRNMDSKEKSSILARNLRAMDPDDAQAMLTKIYVSVSESLRRLSVQVKVLLDITSGIGTPPNTGFRSPKKSPSFQTMDSIVSPSGSMGTKPSISIQEDVQQALDLSSLLGEAVDFVQVQITKVLKVRTEQTAHLSLTEFVRFFSLNRLFADECEAISGRAGTIIKSAVDAQIKDFVSQFVEAQRAQILRVMDADKWDAKDFSPKQDQTLQRVLESGTKDDTSWVETSKIWLPAEDHEHQANGSLTNGDGTAPGKEKLRSAVIDEQKYILPDSAICILQTLEQFQHLTTGIPSMSQEIANGLLDTMRLFNSRSSQLILGAGATRSAGLKNITTKHLALASQALSFMTALIPYVREFFRRHLPSAGSMMAEFDKVKRLYQEHQNGIHEKLIEIMSGRASVHMNSLRQINWEEAARDAKKPTSDYVETLTKETGTLFKVLAKHLPDSNVEMIMTPVFSSYKVQLSAAFSAVQLKSETAKERMLADAHLLRNRFAKINGSGDLGDHIVELVRSKPVESTEKEKKGTEEEKKEGTRQDNTTTA
ncbi:MAG: hypothetical protein Q9227_003997 [Pyrenula ochraceoflavens]